MNSTGAPTVPVGPLELREKPSYDLKPVKYVYLSAQFKALKGKPSPRVSPQRLLVLRHLLLQRLPLSRCVLLRLELRLQRVHALHGRHGFLPRRLLLVQDRRLVVLDVLAVLFDATSMPTELQVTQVSKSYN